MSINGETTNLEMIREIATRARERATFLEHDLREARRFAKLAEASVEFCQETRHRDIADEIMSVIFRSSDLITKRS